MKLDKNDISWEDYNIVYKGIKLPLTLENIQDYKYQTGMDPDGLIIMTYENSTQFKRESKINQILNDGRETS